MYDTSLQDRVDRLVSAHRLRGHLATQLDPLGRPRHNEAPELDPAHYGFTDDDLDREFSSDLSISYDHRVLDGARAARFVQRLCELLEQSLHRLLAVGGRS